MASAHSDDAGAPVWTGSAPRLAHGFIDRPETGAVPRRLTRPRRLGRAGVRHPRRRRPRLAGRVRQDPARRGRRPIAVADGRGGPGHLADRYHPGIGALRLRAEAAARQGVHRRPRDRRRPVHRLAARHDRPWLVVLDDLTAEVDLDKRVPGRPGRTAGS